MPRAPRLIPECGTFHITLRGNNKRRVFRRNYEFNYFKDLINRYKKKYQFLLYHYALMINHIHLCIRATENTDISKMMQGLRLSYYHYQHKLNGYVGHLWQGRFVSKVITDDRYLLTASLYIERNPVDAGIVIDPAEYQWSSYRHYAFSEHAPLIDVNPYYLELGTTSHQRQETYKELMWNSIKESKDRKMNLDEL